MDKLKKFGSCFIRKYFNIETDDMMAKYENFMEILRLIRRVSSIGLEYNNAEILRPRTIEAVRANFFPQIDMIIETISQISSDCR